MDVPVLRFSQAEAVGAELRTRWSSITGEHPPEDLRLADVVQFVLRRARELARQEA